MAVNFSVVGIFYSTQVDLSKVGGNTVAEIIQYLFQTVAPFYYTSVDSGGEQIISSFKYNHPAPFVGRSGIQYPAGSYMLSQTFTSEAPNPYNVWQYYLADANGQRVPVPGTQSYTQTTVQDGWSIVWRLVTICNGPTNLARRLHKLDPKAADALAGTP
ncbi:hypothetical protein [Methylobacterium radiodurans]|uniref:Uncharacterized protein n=1 Tax=Methylobacterium radiodurans TaxID=2202828 RepID=A0A2U8VT37_9HYPH|nr:hypothetical protein [Methylobacterium radiodurans]AWN36933.1 hypothetical protein DK427_15315 [Methylobacterium radiodurans]